MKLDATRAVIEKAAKLGDCETISFGNELCRTTVVIGGRSFKSSLLFVRTPDNQKLLSTISVQFGSVDYPFVKAAFTKTFGPSHEEAAHKFLGLPPEGSEQLLWQGNKTQIRMGSLREEGFVVVEDNWFARGGYVGATVEQWRISEDPVTPPVQRK